MKPIGWYGLIKDYVIKKNVILQCFYILYKMHFFVSLNLPNQKFQSMGEIQQFHLFYLNWFIVLPFLHHHYIIARPFHSFPLKLIFMSLKF